jgi:hypothetical protein
VSPAPFVVSVNDAFALKAVSVAADGGREVVVCANEPQQLTDWLTIARLDDALAGIDLGIGYAGNLAASLRPRRLAAAG